MLGEPRKLTCSVSWNCVLCGKPAYYLVKADGEFLNETERNLLKNGKAYLCRRCGKLLKLIKKSDAPTHVQDSILETVEKYLLGTLEAGTMTPEQVVKLRVSSLAAYGLRNLAIGRDIIELLGIPHRRTSDLSKRWQTLIRLEEDEAYGRAS